MLVFVSLCFPSSGIQLAISHPARIFTGRLGVISPPVLFIGHTVTSRGSRERSYLAVIPRINSILPLLFGFGVSCSWLKGSRAIWVMCGLSPSSQLRVCRVPVFAYRLNYIPTDTINIILLKCDIFYAPSTAVMPVLNSMIK